MFALILHLKYIIFILIIGFLSGCCSPFPAEYINIKDGERLEFSSYQVDSDEYPTYFINEKYEPPRYQLESEVIPVAITPSDEWVVTHRFPGGYILYSASYRDRVCRYYDKEPSGYTGFVNIFGRCISDDHAVVINGDGKVLGWSIRHRIFSPEHRCNRYLKPDGVYKRTWDTGIFFSPPVGVTDINSSILEG